MPAQPFALSQSLHVANTHNMPDHTCTRAGPTINNTPSRQHKKMHHSLPCPVRMTQQKYCMPHSASAQHINNPQGPGYLHGLLPRGGCCLPLSVYSWHFPLSLAHSLLLSCVRCQQPSPKNKPAAHHRPRTHGSNFSSCTRHQNCSGTRSMKQATNRCPCHPLSSTDLHTGKCCSC